MFLEETHPIEKYHYPSRNNKEKRGFEVANNSWLTFGAALGVVFVMGKLSRSGLFFLSLQFCFISDTALLVKGLYL